MPDKVNAPAVSQLAGEIAKAWKRYCDLFGDEPHGTPKQMAALLELIPQSALPEREEKVAKLIAAVKDDICNVPCGPMCCDKLRAALSALGESK